MYIYPILYPKNLISFAKKSLASTRTFPVIFGLTFMFVMFKMYNDNNNRIISIQKQIQIDSENIDHLTEYLQKLKHGQESMYKQYCSKYQDITLKLYGKSMPCDKMSIQR